ncbi:MAG: hypothetical protein U0229_22895 [Anaeromyxobacter sp.]
MRRGAAASLLFLLAACASTPASRGGEHFRCPARGGPEWHEATSAHFTVSGDLTPGEVRSLSRQLEEVRAAIVEGLFPGEGRTVAGRARVVAFRSDEAFDEFAPPGLSAFLWPSGLGDHLIVMPARSGLDRRAVVAHELTHHVLRQAYPRQPRWFGEGYAALAEVLGGGHGLSGLKLHEKPIGPRQLERGESELARKINEAGEDDGFFTDPQVRTVRRFGRLPVELARIHAREPVAVRELLAWNGRVQDARLRASSAVLVHLLLHEESPRFAAYRARLAAAERPEAAWQVTFPEWDPARAGGPEALDERLLAHARRPGHGDWSVDVPVHADPAVRALGASEVHGVRLALPRHDRGRGRGAALERAEVEEALREDPDHVVALFAKAAEEGGDPLPLARRAAAAHPRDLRALLWLSQSLPRDAAGDVERIEILRRAVEAGPGNAMAAGNLAWFLVKAGEVAEALPHAERAVELSPGNPSVLDTLAAALEAAGRCPDALATAERALDFLPEGMPEEARTPWTERASRLRATCGATAATR